MGAWLEKRYHVFTDGDTIYRVRPNPDADPSDKTAGIVIDYTDSGTINGPWHNYIYIPSEAVPHLVTAMMNLVRGDDVHSL